MSSCLRCLRRCARVCVGRPSKRRPKTFRRALVKLESSLTRNNDLRGKLRLFAKTTLSQEGPLKRQEIPIAGPCDGAQFFQDSPLSGTSAFLGKYCFDAVFDASKGAHDSDSVLGPPHEENFRLMPSKNQIAKMDHVSSVERLPFLPSLSNGRAQPAAIRKLSLPGR
jgi:hypothetical protein